MKSKNKQRLVLFLDIIIASVLFFALILSAFGLYTKAFALENDTEVIALENEKVITMPDTSDKSDWDEVDLTNNVEAGGRYYRVKFSNNLELFSFEGIKSMLNGQELVEIYMSINDAGELTINYLTIIDYREETINGIKYLEFYLPESLNYVSEDELNVIQYSPDKKINNVIYSDIKIITKPEYKTVNYYDEMFTMIDKTNKNNWVETDLKAGDTFGNKYYRIELPKSANSVNLFNLNVSVNGFNSLQSVVYNPSIQKIVFYVFTVEYEMVIYDNVTYLEFYLPETYFLKFHLVGSQTNYSLYYDDNFRVTLVSANVKVIEEPINSGIVDTENSGTNNNGEKTESDTGCGTFFNDVGVIVNELFKIKDTSPVATGAATIVIGGLIVLGIVIILFKK